MIIEDYTGTGRIHHSAEHEGSLVGALTMNTVFALGHIRGTEIPPMKTLLGCH